MGRYSSAPLPCNRDVNGVTQTTETMPRLPAAGREHLQAIADFFDDFARHEAGWRRRNRTYCRLIESIHRFLVPEDASILELGSGAGDLLAALRPSRWVGVDVSGRMVELARARHPVKKHREYNEHGYFTRLGSSPKMWLE